MEAVKSFIARWQGREGGAERANYALFLSELADVLGVKRPDPASASSQDYVFERAVKLRHPDNTETTGRIDLYKQGCFVLEAKQSRQLGEAKEVAVVQQSNLFGSDAPQGRRGAKRAWDVLMQNAKVQAERYAKALPEKDGWPPFILICDVGHVIEVFADFSGQGKNYTQFPDRQSFRVYLEDLRDETIRARLKAIWTTPMSLDPARETARVTREIAERLAQVSRALEKQQHKPEAVAMFLMRCLFTMFAESISLLPERRFSQILQECEAAPELLPELVGQLWEVMDTGGFAYALKQKVRRFNGTFFKDRTVLPLGREEIGELRQAATKDWKDVDPSIFGTLLEQALDVKERKSLGAHYTPRAYVERLVVATVIMPLRAEWEIVLSTAERQRVEKRNDDAIATVRGFHDRLCALEVLDPACGTGNFLYVSLELMKRLEGEVLEALANLGGQEALAELDRHNVDPHQFLGLEINPRAVAIAELVLWIGYLQWFTRTQTGVPSEPILRAFKNIEIKDAVLTRPKWPAADYIVGNPPFIGGKYVRERLGEEYVAALWSSNYKVNESADFVMYWWDHAANLLTAKNTRLRRFGFVTTNSITQVFQRKVTQRYLDGKRPISLVMAIPDHPWTKATKDAAAVRVAMTVAQAGYLDGDLLTVESETGLDTDAPGVVLSNLRGRINANLTVGIDVTRAKELKANEGLCSPGVKLHGSGFIVTPNEAVHLGLGRREGLERHIRAYRNGRDLTGRSRNMMVIDLFGLAGNEARLAFPEVYQYILENVKPDREFNSRQSYKDKWWLFGEPRKDFRPALEGLSRFVVTPVTPKHRVFTMLSSEVLPDDALMCIASDDAYTLGVLTSSIHTSWVRANAGTMGAYIGNVRYIKSRCFDPFPFPLANKRQKQKIRDLAEELDAHRKWVLAEQPHLTLTELYNVREQLRARVKPEALNENDRRIFDDGLVLILDELHQRLDVAVAAAYGWDAALPETEILSGLVALNAARAREEAAGTVHWLRPEYQIAKFGSGGEKLDLRGGEARLPEMAVAAEKRAFPKKDLEQTDAVVAALYRSGRLDAGALAARFRQGRKVLPQIDAVLASLVARGEVARLDGGYVLQR